MSFARTGSFRRLLSRITFCFFSNRNLFTKFADFHIIEIWNITCKFSVSLEFAKKFGFFKITLFWRRRFSNLFLFNCFATDSANNLSENCLQLCNIQFRNSFHQRWNKSITEALVSSFSCSSWNCNLESHIFFVSTRWYY